MGGEKTPNNTKAITTTYDGTFATSYSDFLDIENKHVGTDFILQDHRLPYFVTKNRFVKYSSSSPSSLLSTILDLSTKDSLKAPPLPFWNAGNIREIMVL